MDLFDIDRVIKRAVVYFVLSGLVFGIYTISISTFDYFFENMTATASRVAEGALILALILLTNPSRARIQNIVDRLYDRRRYSYRDVVRSTSRAFTTILDFEQLVRTAVSLIDETLQPEFVRLYTVDAGGAAILRGELNRGPYPNPLAEVNLSARTDASLEPLTRALKEADLVTAGDRAEGEDAEAAAQRALRDQRASLTIPMRLEGRLVGFIILGSKRAGGPHTADDLELLRTISDQLSVALENAQAYKIVDQLNLNLESKNIELQEANRELQAAQAELVQKERLATIGMLSGAVAHAIRNPLAGIRAAAQLALLDLDDHVTQPTIVDVVSETDRLDDRIGALLTYSKPFEPELKTVSLSEVAARAVRDTKPRAETQKVGVVLEEITELPPVRVDPDLFEQAIGELISNAIDASPSGTNVVVRTGREGDGGTECVWLEVQDAGPGIRAEQSEQLFELFYTTKSRGTGFGLATVKKIAEGHGGEVLGYNSEGGGACFRIILPTRPRETASA